MSQGTGPIVLKFGGASLEEPRQIGERVRALRRSSVPLVLVVSAREDVTDRLREILDHPRASAAHRGRLREIEAKHPGLPPAGRACLRRLQRLVRALETAGRADPPAADRILSQGERLSAHWLSARLAEEGIPATPVEADRLGLVTDDSYGAARVLMDRSLAMVAGGLSRLWERGRVPVVTGYLGRSLEGRVATLGRGGSDYSATSIGALIGARRVELVKRGVSVLTADPRLVPRARPIRRLSYEEAEELAQFGAKVLHPLTVEPARHVGMEIVVRSLEDSSVATTIGPPTGPRGMRALTLLAPLGLVRVRVPGGRRQPGVVADATRSLSEAGINIVTLFTSSSIFSLVLERSGAHPGRAVLARLFEGGAAEVEGPLRVALLTAIGDGVLDDLGRVPSKILAMGAGLSATPRSLSFAVPVERGREALRALHRALVEGKAR